MSDDIARVTKVRATGDRVLRVRFAGERRDRELDMTGLIARSVHFAPLMDDARAFAKVAIVEHDLGVTWPIKTKWGRVHVSATTPLPIPPDPHRLTRPPFSQWPA